MVMASADETTPNKNCIDQSRQRLRRRWSSQLDESSSFIEEAPKIFHQDESELRERGVENSLVAVWSQFLQYEPSTPTLSVLSKTSKSSTTAGRYHQLEDHHQLSSLQLSSISHPRNYDDDDADNTTSRLSQLPSLPVDGTDTQILLQSFNNRLQDHHQNSLLSPNHELPSPALTVTPTVDEAFVNNHQAIIEHTTADDNNYNLRNITNGNTKKTHRFPSGTTANFPHSPVYEWWRDLGLWCEPECMTYLQSKPIRKSSSSSSTSSGSSSSSNNAADYEKIVSSDYSNGTIETLRKFQRTSRAVKVTFNALHNHFNASNLSQMARTIQVLTTQVQEFVYDYNISTKIFDTKESGDWKFPGLRSSSSLLPKTKREEKDGLTEIVLLQQRVVLQMVDRLKLCAHRCQYTPQQPLAEMKRILTTLEKSFAKLIDMLLMKEIKVLVDELESPTSEIGLRSVLNTVIQLGNEGSKHVCVLVAQQGGIKALLNLSYSSPKGGRPSSSLSSPFDIRILALRGLSSICCVVECIRELEQCNGIALINELLSGRQSSVEDRIETAGVLAQITSPWIKDNIKINGLDEYVPQLVASLTCLAKLNGGDETFLLVTAALANLTFMSPMASASMSKWKTAQTLVKAVRASPFTTLFAKDQVVTVLANMAANANCRYAVMDNDGMNFLLTMLDTKLVGVDLNLPETAAAERVLKKSAIALSRLCNDSSSCEELLRLGGVDRLVELCKDPTERNYCDGILISCLTALKRLKKNSGDGEIILNQLNASDLVQPKLVDSFLEYSNKTQESYV